VTRLRRNWKERERTGHSEGRTIKQAANMRREEWVFTRGKNFRGKLKKVARKDKAIRGPRRIDKNNRPDFEST